MYWSYKLHTKYSCFTQTKYTCITDNIYVYYTFGYYRTSVLHGHFVTIILNYTSHLYIFHH